MSKIVLLHEGLSSKFPAIPTSCKLNRVGYILIAAWCILWSLIPIIALKSTFIDILENIAWGHHFQFGYDKNPYLGAWIGYAGYLISGGGIWINYILSQVFVGLGLLMTWKLAKKLLPEAQALLSMVFMFGINFYAMKATELCDDVMELGFWPLTIYFFYCALKDSQKLRHWLLVGLFAGCSFMVKYYGIVLFASMALVILFTPEGRKLFRHAGIYISALIFIVMTLPNIQFLLEYELVAIHYALERANVDSWNWWNHLKYPWRAIERIAGVLVAPLAVYILLFLPRTPKEQNMNRDRFNSVFLNIICWGPLGFTLLFSIITGGKINYSWVLPCFALIGIYFFYYYRPIINAFNFKVAMTVMIILGVAVFGSIFVIRSTYYQGYKKDGCDYENYPGAAVSDRVTAEWHKLMGKPLPYIIGERTEACHVMIFSPDHPEPYFSANRLFSNWINEEQLFFEGAAVVLSWPEGKIPEWFEDMKKRGVPMTDLKVASLDRAVPDWFIYLMKRPPKQVSFSYCFILPEVREPFGDEMPKDIQAK